MLVGAPLWSVMKQKLTWHFSADMRICSSPGCGGGWWAARNMEGWWWTGGGGDLSPESERLIFRGDEKPDTYFIFKYLHKYIVDLS